MSFSKRLALEIYLHATVRQGRAWNIAYILRVLYSKKHYKRTSFWQ